MPVFMVKINGGEEKPLETETGIYAYAAAAVPAIFNTLLPCEVEIWCPKVMSEYGPYFYKVYEDEYQNIICRHALELYPREGR